MSEEKFLIHDLAEKARITVRTIRYYTDEGLIPQPIIQGKYAYYTLDHLNRLELIRRMKDTYLPLREIRQIINSLTDEEVGQRLMEQTLSNQKDELESNPVQPAPGSGSKALDYIARLMDEQTGHRSGGTANSPQPSPPRKKSGLFPVINDPSDAQSSPSTVENWQRITLAFGVELYLREPVDPNTGSRIQQLIAFAQKLFR